ncbi:MAG: VacJ family lipoprotein [Phenylobacterium sp.]|nr:VacJ family lipoprotein [Phenylobacterium sp.]
MQAALPAAAAALLLAGCATVAGPQTPVAGVLQAAPNPDPFEPLNRALFSLGRGLDRAVARPVATAYRRILPRPARRGVHNALQNADEPMVAINDVLQGRFGAGARTLVRFATNTTVGVVGLFDPAAKAGLPHHDNGFASTLGRYGAPPGPYLYMPVLGPLNVRGAIGGGVDYVADPVALANYSGAATVNVARTSLSLADERAEAEREINALFASATDPYATVRSVFLQSEAASGAGAEPALEALPDMPAAPTETPTPPSAPKMEPPPPPPSPPPP